MEKQVLSKDELPPHKRGHSDSPSPEPPSEEKSNESESSEPSKEVEIESVHSANNWESAELGDDQRKAKFLRLMGAAKKEHKGRFVIGEPVAAKPHGRSSEDERSLEEKLETQYQHRMADALQHRHKKHRGLGFDEEAPSASASSDDPTKTQEETERSADKK